MPPKCLGGEEYSPFADTPSSTPVYVPKGSAEAYRNAPGWNHFTTFYETDDFPVTAISVPETDVRGENARMNDLNGRKLTAPEADRCTSAAERRLLQRTDGLIGECEI